MKKIIVIGKVPQNEKEVKEYKYISEMVDEYGFELISAPVEGGETESFGDYADLYNGIDECDLVIAEISQDSTETGMQLKEADNLSKPIVALTKTNKTHPLVVEQIPTIAEVIEYDDIEDIREGLLRNFAVLE